MNNYNIYSKLSPFVCKFADLFIYLLVLFASFLDSVFLNIKKNHLCYMRTISSSDLIMKEIHVNENAIFLEGLLFYKLVAVHKFLRLISTPNWLLSDIFINKILY